MIDPKKDPARRCMPYEAWPAGDQAAWGQAIRSGDILEGCGPAAHWREGTRRKVMSSYGRFLTFLERRRALDHEVRPEQRVTVDLLRAYIAELQKQVSPITVAGRITDMAEALRVMAPEASLPFLRRAASRLAGAASPKRDKRGRVVSSRVLFELGIRLMDEAETAPCSRPGWRASRYRDGLMIAMLSARPVRRQNFTRIRIGTHLLQSGDHFILVFDATETKNHRPLELRLPTSLSPYLMRYLEIHRPVLLGQIDADRLWISYLGRSMAPGAIYDKIRAVTERELGRALNLHIFRDCQVTSLAREDPGHVGAARALLGHVDPEIMERHYNQARGIEAARIYQDNLMDLRRELQTRRR